MTIRLKNTGNLIIGTLLILLSLQSRAQVLDEFLYFDGINDALSAHSTSVFAYNSDFTIEFWFKTCQDSAIYPQAILGNSSFDFNILGDLLDSVVFFNITVDYPLGTITHGTHQGPPTTDWHHIAITYDISEDEFEAYFDGVHRNLSNTLAYSVSMSHQFHVGKSGMLFREQFKGYIDELRISNTIRYNSSFVPTLNEFTNDSQTSALWHFNDNNPATSATDASGNNNPLTVSSGKPIFIKLDSLTTEGYYDTLINSLTYFTKADTLLSNRWSINGNGQLTVSGSTDTVRIVWDSSTVNQFVLHEVISEGGCTLKTDTIKPPIRVLRLCDGDSAYVNQSYVSSSLLKNDTLVLLNSLNTSIVQEGPTLVSQQDSARYQWVHCDGFIPLPGATNQSFTPSVNGHYAIIINYNWCTDTSDCFVVNNVDLEEGNSLGELTVFPNPSSGKIQIQFPQSIADLKVSQFNTLGKKMYQVKYPGQSVFEFTLQGQKGIYYLEISTNRHRRVIWVVKY